MYLDVLKRNKLPNNDKYLKKKNKIESFNLQYINEPFKKIFIVLNGEIINAIKINYFMRLRELRLQINTKADFVFIFNGNEISYDSELNIIIKDIIQDENIITLKEKESNIIISIDNTNSSFTIKYLTTETLSNLRKKLEIKNKYKFTKNNNLILLSQENLYKIQDILNYKNEIHLTRFDSLENNFSKVEKNLIQGKYILKLDRNIYRMKFNHEILLNEVRKIIDFKDIKNYYFLDLKGEIISKDFENKYTIKSISFKKDDTFNVNLMKKNLPILESKFLKMKNKLKIYKYPNIQLNNSQFEKCRSLIVIGETGSGKTTLLNCLINYVMEIKKDDDFRYIIIDEEDIKKEENSHTLNINSYFILPANKDIPPIKIIDTPGFGDTRENFDSEVLKKFKKFLEEEESIFLICFVMKSSINRNTEFQRYIISNILGLFGKDIISNFMLLFTFFDGGEPLIINSLMSNENPFSKIITNISEPWYILFNNSAIFSEKENFRDVFWDICYDGFSNLILKLKNIEKKSLNLSKNVIKLRNEIMIKANNLNKILDDCLDTENTLNNLIIKFKEGFNELEEYKNFKSIITKENNQKIKTDCGIHNINCIKCQKTCHKFCKEIEKGDISKCKNMVNSFCQVCKCNYKEHHDLPYYFSYNVKNEEKVNQKIYHNFIRTQIKLSKIDSLIEFKIKDLKKCEDEANDCIKNLRNYFENLNTISLFSNIYKIQENFVDYKIIIEKSSKEGDYLKKINIYEKYKKVFNKLNNIYENNNILKELDKFYHDFNINKNKLSESVKVTILNNK